jgi:hypothetical protein
MCDLEFTGRKGFPLAFLGLCFLLMGAKPEAPFPDQDRNPMERREEKLKAFREKRNQFFKADPQSPLLLPLISAPVFIT